jgi:putative PIN family toxin of toxin-antitoxin system
MNKIRALLDANVIVSGIAGYGAQRSVPNILLQNLVEEELFDAVVSADLLREVKRTLLKPYFASRIDAGYERLILDWFEENADRILIPAPIETAATHPEDDFILSAASLGGCDVLVTGDTMLLKLQRYREVMIISPREFLTVIQEFS